MREAGNTYRISGGKSGRNMLFGKSGIGERII
jgi:hypothetical protein